MDFAIEVLLTVCMAAAPTTCKDVKLEFFSETQVTPQQCMMNGQIEIQKYLEAHPKWTLQRWKCREARQRIDA